MLTVSWQSHYSWFPYVSALACMIFVREGWEGSPVGGCMGVCAVWVPVPRPWVTIQPDSDGILSQKGSKVIPYIAALLGQAYMLFLFWVHKRGMPRQCFCHGCPSGEGTARVPMRLHANFSFKFTFKLID
jgi:hypothetical protein